MNSEKSIERPLDLLNALKGEHIKVSLKSDVPDVVGVLITFDIHINMVLVMDNKKFRFIRGNDIVWIDEA
jgi:small nuclear ribonucleoprotein (snRNP)-like protein